MLSLQNNLKELPQVGVTSLHRSVGSAASMRGSNFNMEEIWKPILESNEYEVSSFCRVRTLKPCKKGEEPKILKQYISKTGYYCVGIYQGGGKQRSRKVHRLFAEVFIPNPLNLNQINHKDGNKLNNSILNLEWVSNKQNSEHAWKMGLIKRQIGDKTSNAKLTNEDAKFIFNSNLSNKELAIMYNLHPTSINGIKIGKNWANITGATRKYARKVNPVLVMNIFNSNLNENDIAKTFKVSRQYVNNIKTGKLYSNITGKQYIRKQKTVTKITKNIVIGVKNMIHLRLKDAMNKYNISESVVVKIRAGKFDNLI